MSRVVILLLDGVGIGELPDADEYSDQGSNSLGNVARAVGGLKLTSLQALGLGNIAELDGCPPCPNPQASFGKMAEASVGKDSTTGHWEIAGVMTRERFPVFPHGFPPELVSRFEELIGTKTLCNIAISGTEAIRICGEEHLRTGYPIIYTSADSVFQIACHEDKCPVEKLYEMCRIARQMLTGRWGVARVIARPFTGTPGNFRRTPRRKDYSIEPPAPTLLDIAKAAGQEVSLVGKLDDLFARRGFTKTYHSVNNMESFDQTLAELRREFRGILFTNFIQFDMDWGHRNDVPAYYRGLQDFDRRLPEVLSLLRPDDLLFITSDHGNDPTTPSTDHSREYVPLLVKGSDPSRMVPKGVRPLEGVPRFSGPRRVECDLGIRATFADLGQTAAEYLELPRLNCGTSFLKEITQ